MGDRDVAIRNELGRVLASDAFVASPMLAAFLRFVVEETLAGRDDRLKAYTIAVGALDRPESFDPNENPVVRVQARRLRQALQRHYETVGVGAAIRIELPLGNYVPVFVGVERCPPTQDESSAPPARLVGETTPPPTETPQRRRLGRRVRSMLSISLAALIGVAVGFGGWQLWHRYESTGGLIDPASSTALLATADERRGLDASRVLPLLKIDVDASRTGETLDSDIYRNRLESFARRFDDTVVLTRRSPDYPTPDGQPLYVLNVLVSRDGNTINAYYRLIHAGDDRILASGAVTLGRDPLSPVGLDDRSTTPADLALVRDFVQMHGTITRDLANITDITPELSCLTRAWNFTLDSTADGLLASRSCLEPVVEQNPRLTPALALLGTVYLREYTRHVVDLPGDPLARAELMLRRAIRLSPSSSSPYQVLQNLLLIKEDFVSALEAGARSIQLNPEDMNAVGGYGTVLARLGRYEEALALMRRAEANLAVLPKVLQYYQFLALNNLGLTEEADRCVTHLQGTRSTLFLTAVAIRAHRRRDTDSTTTALAMITALEPSVATAPYAFLRRRGFSNAVIDRLMIDLRAAGFAGRADVRTTGTSP